MDHRFPVDDPNRNARLLGLRGESPTRAERMERDEELKALLKRNIASYFS